MYKSPFKRTHICFKCMNSARRDGPVICPICRQEMVSLHYRIHIPKKSRKKWNKFADWLASYWVYYADKIEKY